MVIEKLELNVETNAGDSASQLRSLSSALNDIRNAAKGSFNSSGISKLAQSINELTVATFGSGDVATSISNIASSLQSLASVGRISISTNLSTAIPDLVSAISAIPADTETRIDSLAYSLSSLSSVGSVSIDPSIATQLRAISNAGASITEHSVENIRALADALGNLDSLSIGASAGGALSDLAARMNEASAAAEVLRSSMSGLSTGAIGLRKPAKDIEKIGQAAKKSERETNKLLASIKRIAFYRVLRTMIKNIGQAFREGLQQAYLFSQGIVTEGHRFSEAMDSMKSSVTQMKGQLGSALIGLLTALQPVIERIVALITKVADVVSQFFAAFTGSTYLRAVKTQASFADTTARGAKAAKEWKNQLLGFDEINKLNAPSDTTSGSGTNLADGYEFEDTKISEGIANFVAKIKEKFENLKKNIDFSRLKDSLGRLGESFSKLWARIKEGFGWVWEKILEPLAKWVIEEAAPRLVDLLAKAFDFLSAVFDKLKPVLEPLWEDVLKPFFEFCGDLIIAGLDGLIDLLEDLTKLINGEISFEEFIDGLDGVQIILLALGGAAVISGITSLAGSVVSLAGTFKFQAGLLAGSVASILGNINQLMEASNTYQEAANAHQNETQTALLNYKKLYKERGKEIADEWANIVYQIDLSGADFEQAQQLLTYKIDGLWADVPESMWDGFAAGWDHYFGDEGVGLGQYMSDAFTGSIDGIKSLLGIHSPSTVFEDIGENTVKGLENGFDNTWNDFMSGLKQKVDSLKSWWKGINLGSFSVQTPRLQTAGGYGGNVARTTARLYASGGLPDVGELFIARERGPELVGTIGGNNAVANNEQIEAGIEEAAFRGFVRAMSASGDNRKSGDVVLNINGREFARATFKDYKAAERENGGSLINNYR